MISGGNRVRLGDHVEALAGNAFKSSGYAQDPTATAVLCPPDIGFGDIDLEGCRRWHREPGDGLDRYLLEPGDVVIGLNRPVVSGGLKWGQIREADTPVLLNQRAVRLRSTSTLTASYLRCVIGSPQYRSHVANLMSGANMPYISLPDIQGFTFVLPERVVQDRVSMAIGAFDDLIENNRRRIEILEEMARLLYREWFVHFRFPGHEDVELVDSELGPIPEGWKVRTLSDFCEHKKRNLTPHNFEGEEFLHYSIPALDADRLPSLEPGETIRSGKYEMVQDCVLLSKLNPRFPRVWRSRGPYTHRAVCSTEFLVLESSPEGWPLDYLQCFVQNSDLGSRLAQMAGGTSTSHQRVKPGDVMALPIIAPLDDLVDALSERLQPTNELVLNLVDQNRVLREARDLLLPRLVSGELDVSELDLDGVLA